jgi:hypothetical protein
MATVKIVLKLMREAKLPLEFTGVDEGQQQL